MMQQLLMLFLDDAVGIGAAFTLLLIVMISCCCVHYSLCADIGYSVTAHEIVAVAVRSCVAEFITLSLPPHSAAAAVYDVLVNKHDFSPEIAASVSSKLSRFRSPERADSILTFLKQNSFSTTQLQRLVKSDPRILTASAEDGVKLKIHIFKDFGFPPEETAKIMSSNNAIIHSSAEKKIIPQLSTLKALLGSNSEVVDLVRKESWEAKIQGFRDLGVSESEVVEMFRRSPLVICTSLEKCREIKRLLLGTGRFEMGDLISDPSTFLCSVERRYKPRLEVLEVSESKGLIRRWPSLSSVCRWTDERFFGVFVRPYADQLG
ncbi:uncharacterized protein LOC121765606 [Salvia splendens]|uniref:uncharacterized protein LOC121765606 n=1 Tax=Salvia splendens TaxID=180675 RepID=UPI001C27712F|nr:uncharacterized protein LOC121765606 [Salvia splendens]